MKRSQLNEIPGIGASRIRDLLEHFKSIEAIRIASIEDLYSKRIRKNMAEEIFNYFMRYKISSIEIIHYF